VGEKLVVVPVVEDWIFGVGLALAGHAMGETGRRARDRGGSAGLSSGRLKALRRCGQWIGCKPRHKGEEHEVGNHWPKSVTRSQANPLHPSIKAYTGPLRYSPSYKL
jgi:hypothetical protein